MLDFLKSLLDFRDEKKQRLHIVLLSFIGAFVLARLLTQQWGGELYIKGFHIHHFYWGMLSLSIGGIIGVLSAKHRMMQIASMLVGIGIGVFADEIGLLLNCTTPTRNCTYFFGDTYDIVVTIGIVIVLIIMTVELVARIKKRYT